MTGYVSTRYYRAPEIMVRAALGAVLCDAAVDLPCSHCSSRLSTLFLTAGALSVVLTCRFFSLPSKVAAL